MFRRSRTNDADRIHLQVTQRCPKFGRWRHLPNVIWLAQK